VTLGFLTTPRGIPADKLMTMPHWDEPLLDELTRVMSDASICGLGQAAMNPVKQVLNHFREDLR